jgi:TPR repeat protein
VDYAQGHGVPQDYAEAYFWFDLAASGKVESADFTQKDADENRDKAAAHLSPAELVRVQERAKQWFEAHPAQSETP